MRDQSDNRTPDLFRHEPLTRLGKDFRAEYSDTVGRMLASHNRDQVAARMTSLLGRGVSTHMLNAWASPARESHNIPAYAVPFLELSLDCHELTDLSVGIHGGQALYGEAAIQAVLDRQLRELEISREVTAKRIRALRKRMEELG
jgi:hypothetical protein